MNNRIIKYIIIMSIVSLTALGGIFISTYGGSSEQNDNFDNVTISNNQQIIEIGVKGGYIPRQTVAKANIPTILRFVTNSTFDCSAAIYIPSLNVSKNLPFSGTTDIDIGNPQPGTVRGSCSMGMYFFEIDFNN